ncbi:prephenate dehydratase [Caldicellulosiruptoraceae bacterium PP1]
MKVIYLGPEGSYSNIAAKKISKDIYPFDTIDDIFDEVEKNQDVLGVVPVENSIEGSVSVTLDLLLQKNVYIIKEIILDIKHYLCYKINKKISSIASHPQALSQCHEYLRNNFENAKIISAQSTSHAAKLCFEGYVDAAICSYEASKIYNLDIFYGPINNNNMTRFFVIHNKPLFEKRHNNKTSLIFSTYNKPGSLYKILAIFDLWDINLTKIESRPSKKELGQYIFYIDVEGFYDDENISEALKIIKRKTTFYKFLGSYDIEK